MTSSSSANVRALGLLFLAGLTVLLWTTPAQAGLLIKPPLYVGLNSGLVGFWSLNQTDIAGTVAYDRSGNANNGTLTNGPVRTIGKIGQALQFDGVNDYVGLANPTGLQLTGSMTISAWTYLRTTPPSEDSQIVFKGNNTSDKAYGLNYSVDNGPIQGRVQLSSTGSDSISRYSASTLAINSWYHIVGVYNATTQTLDIYINGSINNGTLAGTVPAAVFNASNDINIGKTANSAGLFNGLIDDVRIYNRALSAQEVKRLYNIGGTLHIGASQNKKLTNGLVGLWSFDQADIAGTMAYDRSGQGNNGTLTNGPRREIGKIGQGLSFDNTNDYVSAPTTNLSVDDFSVAAWVYVTGRGNGYYNPVVTSRTDQSIVRAFEIAIVGGRVQAGVWVTDTDSDIISAGLVATSTWSHVVFTRQGANLKVFINGVQDPNTATESGSMDFTTCPLFIGGDTDNSDCTIVDGGNFGGSLDDVRIYNRALNAQEVKRLYNIGGTLHIGASQNKKLTNGLVGLWSFDQADVAGTVAYDRSGQGNNGTMTNGPARTIGKIGQGLDFDGSDDYVAVPGQSLSGAFTWSAWIYPRIIHASENQALYGCNNRYFNLEVGTNQLTYWNNGAAGSATFGVVPTKSWQHVVFVYDGVLLRAYLNGVSFGSPLTTTISSGACTGELGGLQAAAEDFNGIIDDLRIYNQALSADEIKRLYSMGHSN